MHVLTLKQPWAYAVFHFGKDVENRPRSTSYRGRIYIHAGLKTDDDAVRHLTDYGYDTPPAFQHGLIIGSVELVDCHNDGPSSCSSWAQRGAWHWVLRNPRLLDTPVQHRGLPYLHRRKEPL